MERGEVTLKDSCLLKLIGHAWTAVISEMQFHVSFRQLQEDAVLWTLCFLPTVQMMHAETKQGKTGGSQCF